MKCLYSKPVVEEIYREVMERTRVFELAQNRRPKLVVVLVGDDPASVIYTERKGSAALKLGLDHETIRLPKTVEPNTVKEVISQLNMDKTVDGILIQRPLPKWFSEGEVVYWVDPKKDVDAFHPENTGRLVLGLPCFEPCTPTGVMELLKHYQINLTGKLACIIGRSSIVGKPMASLLLQANATVIHCHSKTTNLKKLTLEADLVIAALGKQEFLDPSYFKKSAIVIDVGIHRNKKGKIVGDIQKEGLNVEAYSPVPGGVGPMTIAILMRNTVRAAENSM